MSNTTGEKPSRKKGKIGKTILLIIAIGAAVAAVFILVGTILHATYFSSKYERIEPYGRLVDVYDGQMHLLSMGTGSHTVVLLPGMGVALPSADFGPLMRRLAEKHKVVCIEYFGVGFSSTTARARTCENYVEEIRAALAEAGIAAPYVLMAHSISSVYAEYYAGKYPDEIEAVISLDGTSTAYYEKMPDIVKAVLPVAKIQQATGFTSIMASLLVNEGKLRDFGYTEKEIGDIVVFTGFTMNDTVLAQILASAEFVGETINVPYPGSVPYFKVISRQTYETPNKQIKMTPQEYQERHLARIGKTARYEIMDGSHFIYLNNVGRIAEITDEVVLRKD